MSVQNHENSAGRSSHQFMLRLWLEELGNEQYELRGSVQHINSGEMLYFRDWPKMEGFIEKQLYKTDCEGSPNSRGEETRGEY